tara:strand:- start:4560 stop:4769 length:210 start_codon:yes stop_codon:yes gene_type:complete
MTTTSCEALDGRMKERVKEHGLVDVKFLLGNAGEASFDLVCEEVGRLYDALERNEYRKVPTFKDTHKED